MGIRHVGAVLVISLLLAACGGSGASSGSVTVTRTATGSGGATAPVTPTSGSSTTASGPGATTGAASTPAGPPPCQASTLTLTFLGGQGATGHGELGFALRNAGSASCSTVGYPGIQFLDRNGGSLPTTPTHTTSDFFGTTPERQLTVPPGQSVSFRLGVTHGAGSSAGCTTAHGLQVIAPNDTATLRVQIPGGAFECGTATVSPMQPGDSAYR